jgi:2-keto-4-pentenoate hydratase/2-oxohepta-3-ene-1,7-dioic acid hydratase in catechol pathway
MRIASIEHGNKAHWGAIDGGHLICLEDQWPTLTSALEHLPALPAALDRSRQRIPLAEIRSWCPPVITPSKIFCVGLNYRSHAQETGKTAVKAHPSIFPRFADSFVGHEQVVIKPSISDAFDYEAELAVVIGRGGRHIPAKHALEHVAGYTCVAENSARDYQKHNAQVTPGKNFYHSGAVGPWLVTPDEIGDVTRLSIQGRLNGRVMQSATLSELIFSIPQIIAYVSSFTPLAPGDMISTGTPEGVGAARVPPVFMKEGDLFEVEISRIGILSNRVAAESA